MRRGRLYANGIYDVYTTRYIDICGGLGSDILLIILLLAVRLLMADDYITVSSFSDSVKSSKSFEVTQPKSSILTPNLPGI